MTSRNRPTTPADDGAGRAAHDLSAGGATLPAVTHPADRPAAAATVDATPDGGVVIHIDMAYVWHQRLDRRLAAGLPLPEGATLDGILQWRAEHPDYDPGKPFGGQPVPADIVESNLDRALGHLLPDSAVESGLSRILGGPPPARDVAVEAPPRTAAGDLADLAADGLHLDVADHDALEARAAQVIDSLNPESAAARKAGAALALQQVLAHLNTEIDSPGAAMRVVRGVAARMGVDL